MMKRNDGFTLVELVVSIAIASLVMMAATTVMLLGLRINAKTTQNIEQQNTTNMLTQVLQEVAEKENISVDSETNIKIGDASIVSYADKTVYLKEAVYIENVDGFEAELTHNNQLLTVRITVNNHTYESSVYCRLNAPTGTGEEGEAQ